MTTAYEGAFDRNDFSRLTRAERREYERRLKLTLSDDYECSTKELVSSSDARGSYALHCTMPEVPMYDVDCDEDEERRRLEYVPSRRTPTKLTLMIENWLHTNGLKS